MFQVNEIVNQVIAARAGDMAAWNALYQYYYPRLLNTALPICGNSAKDIVQDTFLTAFLKLSQLKDPHAFGGWIKKIAAHKSYRVLNKLEMVLTQEPEWEEQPEEADKQTRLHGVIANLPEALRTTLLLRYFSRRNSYNEIAEILSVPVGTVRSRLNEAKAKLHAGWLKPVHGNDKEREEWNNFYHETLSGLHYDAEQRRIFLSHIQKDTAVAAPGNKMFNNGRGFFAGLVAGDQQCGSWLKPVDIISSGNISVIEQAHFNSPEHPHHCPPACVVIICRKEGKAANVHIHAAGR